jgi:hypothetical protein
MSNDRASRQPGNFAPTRPSREAKEGVLAAHTSRPAQLTLEERRERRRLRREKQREDNVHRAARMHAARLKMDVSSLKGPPQWSSSLHVGCSGWRYWKWRDSFYAGVPQNDWFDHYLRRFDTVEINASFYSCSQMSRLGGAPPAGGSSFTPSRSASSLPISRDLKAPKLLSGILA